VVRLAYSEETNALFWRLREGRRACGDPTDRSGIFGSVEPAIVLVRVPAGCKPGAVGISAAEARSKYTDGLRKRGAIYELLRHFQAHVRSGGTSDSTNTALTWRG